MCSVEERELDENSPIRSQLKTSEDKRPSIFLRYRDMDSERGMIKVYPGVLRYNDTWLHHFWYIFLFKRAIFWFRGGEIMTLTWPWFGNRRVKFDLIDYKTKWCLFDCLKILWIFYYDKYKKTLSLKENLKPGLSNCCCMYRVSGSYKNIEIGSDMTCVDVIREALQKFGVEVSSRIKGKWIWKIFHLAF